MSHDDGACHGKDEDASTLFTTPYHVPEDDEPDSRLLLSMLDSVVDGISKFCPSPSLAQLHGHVNTGHHVHGQAGAGAGGADGYLMHNGNDGTTDIDLVCSGGGLRGYYVTGASYVLQQQLRRRNIRVARFAGASCGAWCAMFMASGLSTGHWLHTYRLSQRAVKHGGGMPIHTAYRDIVWPWLRTVLPPDAYRRCSGRVFISITVFSSLGVPTNLMVSRFTSNHDLFEACLASSTIPFVTESGLGPRFRGMRVVDGGVTCNTPVFKDGVRRQLVIQLSQVRYPWRCLVTPVDECIEGLVMRGAIQMGRFLQGRPTGSSIVWLERRQSANEVQPPGHRRRVWVAMVAVASLVGLGAGRRGLGTLAAWLGAAVRRLFSVHKAPVASAVRAPRAAVVQFASFVAVMQGGARYVAAVLAAVFVGALQRARLLL